MWSCKMSWLKGEIACLIHDEAWDLRKDGAHSVRRVFKDLAAVFILTNRLPALSKARPNGAFNLAKVVRSPFQVYLKT